MKLFKSKNYLARQIKTKTYFQIAKENNTSRSTIHRSLKKLGLTKDAVKKWTGRELQLLKKEYAVNPRIYDLFPSRTISGVNHKAFRLKLKKSIRKSKYRVEQYFFNKWSSEMAYIFGLFCSDGYVSSNCNCIGFHINKKDIELFEIIKRVMKSTHPIKKYNDGIQLRIFNQILHDSLIKLGCPPNKSRILDFPYIPDKYLNHFIRGYFDGDGSIHFNKPNTIKISFCSTKSFIQILQRKLKKHLKLNIHPIRKYKNIWVCMYYGDDARKFCYWIYKECKESYLRRKKERFDTHIKLRENGKI